MYRLILPVTIFLCLWMAGAAEATQILSVDQSADELPQYEMIEISITLDRDYLNPYDPGEVDLVGIVTDPSGGERSVPGFWYEPYERSLSGEEEVFTAAGPGKWRVRYAPGQQGEYSYRVQLTDIDGQVTSGSYLFSVSPAVSQGFVRVDERNRRYFVYDEGGSYVPLGYNIDWVTEPSGAYAYLEYMDHLVAGGGNWTRLWLSHFGQGTILEWGDYHHTGYYQGLGRYSQQIGCKLDAIFSAAQDWGVTIQLALHQHSQFESPQWSSWEANPYNVANGGPCQTSADYFTDPEALRLADNLHRYLVARYAAYRSLLAWEIFNEADGITGVRMDLMNPWSQNVAERLRELDPSAHMVTTSYATPIKLPTFDIDTWDFNNRHQYVYGSWLVNLFLQPYFQAEKPLILSEFGIDWFAAMNERDPEGVNIHNGIWAALMSGYAGGAMNWWWDNYIEPQNLWHLNLAPAAFVDGEDMSRFNRSLDVVAEHERAWLVAGGLGAEREGELCEAWLWVRAARSDWWWSGAVGPVEGAEVTVAGLAADTALSWTGEVWDTWAGEVVDGVAGESEGETFSFLLSAFVRDVAVKLIAEEIPDDDVADDDVTDDDATDDDAVDDDAADDDVVDDDVVDDDVGDDDLAQNGDSDDDSENTGCGCG